jgi:hypothetical protein
MTRVPKRVYLVRHAGRSGAHYFQRANSDKERDDLLQALPTASKPKVFEYTLVEPTPKPLGKAKGRR